MLAKMYGQLPSYVLANATVFDLVVANALAEYENKQLDPSSAKLDHNLSQEQLMAMIKSVRAK